MVSLRVYNVLGQVIAVPIVQGREEPLSNLTLECGQSYVAYWDGKVAGTGREAATGIYLYELVVNDERMAKKMFVAR